MGQQGNPRMSSEEAKREYLGGELRMCGPGGRNDGAKNVSSSGK